MNHLDANEGLQGLAYWMRHAAFEQCPEPLMLLDPTKNQYIDCNIAACELLGFSRAEILKMPITQIHGQELGQLIVFTEEAMQTGRAKSQRISCRLKSDLHIPVELSASRTVIKGREYLVVALRDIHADQRNQQVSHADESARNGLLEWKYLQTIFQQGERENLLMLSSVGDGIYCVDTDGLCTFVNPAAKRLLGREDSDVLGVNIHYVHHHTHEDGTHYPVEECPIYAAIRDGVVHEGIQEVFWKRDGSPFPVEFTSTPIISEGSITGAVVVFRDISQRIETERKLHDALNELGELKIKLEDENAYLQQEILSEQRYHGIIGESPAIKAITQQIGMVAQTEASVLITGESGTGKELIARAIHEASNRKESPLIRVNCAAIPRELFESEFFGYIRGAFTGAMRDRMGRFELANGGTLFLDEVGEIPIELQSKLLRVLQEGQFERVGEEKTRQVSVRVIAATNKDLKKEVAAQRFREDLFFRLNVFPIHSPPLRHRRNDITLLSVHFLALIAEKFNKAECKLRQSDLQQLLHYDWPGNIRELQNVIERAVITAQKGRLTIDLPKASNQPATQEIPAPEDAVMTDDAMQLKVKKNMLKALEQCDWKLSGSDGAAAILGMRPTTLASRIKRLGLKRE